MAIQTIHSPLVCVMQGFEDGAYTGQFILVVFVLPMNYNKPGMRKVLAAGLEKNFFLVYPLASYQLF